MQDRKKVVASISLVVFLGRTFLHWVGFGLEIDDPEFDQAIVWADNTWIKETWIIQAYPFSPVTRAEAAVRYVLLAQDIGLVPDGNTDECIFSDLEWFSEQEKDTIVLACLFEFFKWTEGKFHPNEYVTKANSLVALMRWLSPAREFPIEQPYWTPYVQLAFAEWITKRESWPYLMYLITKYELVLQLYRVHERKK